MSAPVECPFCGRPFRSYVALTVHVDRAPTLCNGYRCAHCTFRAPSAVELYEHTIAAHAGPGSHAGGRT